MKKICLWLSALLLFSCTSKFDNITPKVDLRFTNVVYQPTVTKLVAVHGQNILVRGSLPIDSSGIFVYFPIRNYLMTKLSINMVYYTLIDVSLVDNIPRGELTQLNQELLNFNLPDSAVPSVWPPYTIGYKAKLLGKSVYFETARFLWWPIQGYDPALPWAQKVGQFFTNTGYNGQTGGFNFDGLVDRLDSLLNDETYPKVIYYHCISGNDRTGALTFAWLVKHGGLSKAAALATVDSVATPNNDYMGMINDYYTWLFP
jgi:hypothetical protein